MFVHRVWCCVRRKYDTVAFIKHKRPTLPSLKYPKLTIFTMLFFSHLELSLCETLQCFHPVLFLFNFWLFPHDSNFAWELQRRPESNAFFAQLHTRSSQMRVSLHCLVIRVLSTFAGISEFFLQCPLWNSSFLKQIYDDILINTLKASYTYKVVFLILFTTSFTSLISRGTCRFTSIFFF